MPFDIPPELATMLSERRVIPFIGAGVSASLGLPDWDGLLARVAVHIDPSITYDELKRYCNADPLQIAEYLYLRADKSIGPLRHEISNELRVATNPILSGAHVELVNLGAPQIYTTNFDDFIENTFRELAQPFQVIAVPKDVATASTTRPQVVKYHGDLRFDQTLVLTESSYYTRLDFESPMDLKFRSDLLGRSVLFMGYSFRDINIRVIWFKLMQMMKDIPEADRPKSYIVRFDRNPVLESLYDSVGIRTIVLDPDNKVGPTERSQLFADFMLDLSVLVARDSKMPGQAKSMFVSTRLIERVRDSLTVRSVRRLPRPPFLRHVFDTALIRHMAGRQVPSQLADDVARLLLDLARSEARYEPEVALMAVEHSKQFGGSPGATLVIALGLIREVPREAILTASNVPWSAIWSQPVAAADVAILLKLVRGELSSHKTGEMLDEDLAYGVDLLARLGRGMLNKDADTVDSAKAMLAEAAELYPSIGDYVPDATAGPNVHDITQEINERVAAEGDSSSDDDDVPF